jgi:anion-transporting  ArsA/GET3 family ATPase
MCPLLCRSGSGFAAFRRQIQRIEAQRQWHLFATALLVRMPPMSASRLLFITGKGGTGKTTVAAALGRRAVELGERVLIVDTARDGRLSDLFAGPELTSTPQPLQPRLDALSVEPRALVEAYFAGLLRIPFVSRRLLSSRTFNAVTAAAPGITEFLLLEQILGWVEPGLGRRRRYGVVIVDGPATGHALKLLRVPRNVLSMVPAGPLATTARRMLALLHEPRRTQIVLVAVPEEMSVRETIETWETLTDELALRVARPVLNRVFPRHFSPADAELLATEGNALDPAVAAARYAIACRREAERHVSHLRRAVHNGPVLMRQLFTADVSAGDLHHFGVLLGRAILH